MGWGKKMIASPKKRKKGKEKKEKKKGKGKGKRKKGKRKGKEKGRKQEKMKISKTFWWIEIIFFPQEGKEYHIFF